MAGFYKPLMRNGVLRKEIYSDSGGGLYNTSDVILSPTNDVNTATATIDQAARSTVLFFSRNLTAVDIAIGDVVSFGAGVYYKITSIHNCRMYTDRGANGTANVGTKGVRVECTADREETAARLLITSATNWQCTITGGATESLIASKIKAYATDSVTQGVQTGWGSAHTAVKLKAYAVMAQSDIQDGASVDITSLMSQTATIDDANALAYKIADVANNTRSVSTVKLIIGFDLTSVNNAPDFADVIQGYNSPIPISEDFFNQVAKANKGKLVFTLGNSTVETPLPLNVPQENETVENSQNYHVSEYDNYGIARKVVVNGNVYNLPIIEISPSASQLKENQLKIDTYTSTQSMQAELVTEFMAVLAPLAAGADIPFLSAALKPVLENAIPPEFKDSLAYIMYQISPALQTIASPAQSLMGKHSTGSANLGIYTGCSFYAAYPIMQMPAYTNGISAVINNEGVSGQTMLNTLQPGEYNISAYPLSTYTLSPQYAACVKDLKNILSDLIIA